ncbi:MAG: chromate resistance protein ChrB domain-containing protein [Burkholderiales bacterium]
MDASISPKELQTQLAGANPPLVIDVRRTPAFRGSSEMIAGALRRDPATLNDWSGALPRAREVVVYCVHGHEVSQNAAKALRDAGLSAGFLDGGIEEGWVGNGGAVAHKPKDGATRWITRERPKIDRIACPWLITRFVDPDAEFLYVPTPDVKRIAAERDAMPYDIPDVAFSHVGEWCSFDAFIKTYRLAEPALDRLATIVRGAETGRRELAPQSAGLLAVSLGLSRNFSDDHAMLKQGMVMYDALYAWCKDGQSETHSWNPALVV